MTEHVPVLPEAVDRLASARPGERWVDATLGFGGHTASLLGAGATVLAVDRDPEARAAASARLSDFADRLTVVAGNFRDLPRVLSAAADAFGAAPVDGVLADVGVSSWQLDQARRGFSFSAAGPVDMRMDTQSGGTALELIEGASVPELADLIRRWGEEPFAGPIARALKGWAAGPGPHDTVALAEAIRAALPRKEAARRSHHPATRTFQALRIAVNDELGALDALLVDGPTLLAPGGRLLVIAFHSLEDRRVKRAFAALCGRAPVQPPRRGLPPPLAPPPEFELLTTRAVVADADELARNPRARSARLRAIRRKEAA